MAGRHLAWLVLACRALPVAPDAAAIWTCDELTPSLCNLPAKTGDVVVRGLRVRYWIYGDGIDPPLVTIHGGPGWAHDYILPLKQLACRGRQVLFYDQGGAGVSERPKDIQTAPWLLTKDYYVEELYTLLTHLGWLEQPFHILGHSWGTIVAQLVAHNPPAHLKSVIMAGPLSDAKLYIDAQWDPVEGSLGTLPPFMQKRIHALEAKKNYDGPEYQALDSVLTTYFTLRTAPMPDCFQRANAGMNKDIYVGMQGASEFTVGGVLADLNITADLKRIRVPVLLTTGKFDTMRPPLLRTMLANLADGRWHMFPHAGHVSMIDDAGAMNDVVDAFLVDPYSAAFQTEPIETSSQRAASADVSQVVPARQDGPDPRVIVA